MRLSANMIALLAFLAAGLLATLGAFWAVTVIENRSSDAVSKALQQAGYEWVDVASDGLQVQLSGTAPTEAQRFRALTISASIINSARVIDMMQVADAAAINAPRFSLEVLRNDAGISLIGLIPAATGREPILDKIATLAKGVPVTDMLEAADHPVPPGWDAALAYGLDAMRMLPRSKISIDSSRVAITAIGDSAAQKRRLEADLTRRAPKGVQLELNISAPRPVLTPFTLRFLVDENGPHFDACSADTEQAQAAILKAAEEAGVTGKVDCTIGLGVPSPRWAEAAVAGIRAMAALGAGSITFSDADVTLMATQETSPALFDRVVGELGARLPDVFSLQAVLPEKPRDTPAEGPAEFTAVLDPDGKVTLRGRLTDELLRTAVDSYAQAHFGADAVFTATRLDPELPDGWPVKVLAGLEALSQLHDGSLNVREDMVEVRGNTGNTESRAAMSRILSAKLGMGAKFRLAVTYDEELDPLAALPTPEECVTAINTILNSRKITFSPGAATIDADAAETLDKIAEQMRQCQDVRMEIGGHTDSQGRDEMNLQLSQGRAEAVLEALLSRHVPISHLSAKGYGKTQPIADNDTEEGREQNRRIEFKLIRPEDEAAAQDAVTTSQAPPAAPEDTDTAAEEPLDTD